MLRDRRPIRTAQAAKPHYRAYKPELRIDFGECCGYCDTPDYVLGGVRAFQIDHFAPNGTAVWIQPCVCRSTVVPDEAYTRRSKMYYDSTPG